ncbi:hypothetical protein RUESEDTHA_00880 [Ruegeria sp. THAF57]|uniref:DUF4917 family protein n=1 Tax=Ruegeria sp. THAF57 TaxID=2744555 RepID=UPI0015DE7259|nr:DUF4917 family protein [Ruegeria sp. THAF57]CAD0184002.1 hypothetical protein RUESEDTHA_00880 [Ruegeria sp. THAF57]
MTKKLVIFGNGLGRSFDNEFYQLERALKASWDEKGVLDEEQKKLICNCLEDDIIEDELKAPTSEEQLKNLQKILDACDMIKTFEARDGAPDLGWLSEHGKRFPIAIRKYFHHAASQFHNPNKRLPEQFASQLRKFVRSDRPHIATLNYDDLLYECFTDTDVFQEHMLRDGFFGEFNIERHRQFHDTNKEGWFLHLHGSPLFVNRNGSPRKILRSQLFNYLGNNSVHLVLTNAKSKPAVISNSQILSEYWSELAKILEKPSDVTLFGYGGDDLHLNKLLAEANDDTTIRIVCREGSKTKDQAEKFWRGRLSPKSENKIAVTQVSKLNEFDGW